MEPKRTNCETCPYQLESHKEHIDYPVYYCIGKGQKNARRLKKKDRGAFPPDWCPRYLEPPKLRIYTPAGRKHAIRPIRPRCNIRCGWKWILRFPPITCIRALWACWNGGRSGQRISVSLLGRRYRMRTYWKWTMGFVRHFSISTHEWMRSSRWSTSKPNIYVGESDKRNQKMAETTGQ